jgi:nitrous oxide reductase
MNDDDTRISSRREFFRSAGRVGAVGALGALGAALIARSTTGGAAPAAACGGAELCGRCEARRHCALPAARKAASQAEVRSPP